MGVVLLGTADTNNALSQEQGGYNNISVGWLLGQPTMELLKYLKSDVKPGSTAADCKYLQ